MFILISYCSWHIADKEAVSELEMNGTDGPQCNMEFLSRRFSTSVNGQNLSALISKCNLAWAPSRF